MTRRHQARRGVATVVLLSVTLSAAAAALGGESTDGIAERVGVSPGAALLWLSDAQLAEDLDAIAASGARWVRVDLDWPSIEPAPGQLDWRRADRVVDAAHERELRVLALPAYTPTWARPPGTSDKVPPTDPDDFARFVGAAAARYVPRGVVTYEIWNEPNVASFWAPQPDVAAYAELLVRAAAAIEEAAPSAVVLTGGTAPSADRADGAGIAPLTFLQGLYEHGARDAFDAVAVHPYSFPALPMQVEPWNPFVRLPEQRELMVANGDGDKPIWGTEYGAPTGTSARSVGEARQATMVREAYRSWLALEWTGPLLWYANRDYGDDLDNPEANFGLRRYDGTPKPAWDAFTAVLTPPDMA